MSIQNDESAGIDNTSPWYGGWAYSGLSSSWSDLSNTQWTMMGLDAANLSKSDSTWSKAETFVTRCQNFEATNPTYNYNNDGGFAYQPPTVACCGRYVSYGSMTAAGVWGLRLAGVPTDDQRVLAGLNWLRYNYSPIVIKGNAQNPYFPSWYLYYYLLGFAKALIMTGVPVGSWQENASQDITDYIVSQQSADGHWTTPSEGDIFATEQAILALQTRTIPTDIKRLSWLTFILHSNADLHIYDPLGRHVGKNYEIGGIDLQIPNATYSTNAVQNITIPGLEAGNYRIVLIGTGTGQYTLNVKGGVGDAVVSEESYTRTISEGEAHEATVNVAMITWLTIHVEEPSPIEATVKSATGTGNVSFVSDVGNIQNLRAVNESDLPTEGKPDLQFPHGFFFFNITGLANGQNVTLTIAFPSNISTTAQYWKYHTPEGWYQIPMGSNDGDNIITIQLTDGGLGDDDGTANGVIVDAGGPGIKIANAIYGIKFHDKNGNRIKDADEGGLANWTIRLVGIEFNGLNKASNKIAIPDFNAYNLTNLTPELYEESLANWTKKLEESQTVGRRIVKRIVTTDSNGYYGFADLRPGFYIVSEKLKPGWLPTTPPARFINLSMGQSIDVDFGNKRLTPEVCNTSVIYGNKFNDTNNNKTFDPGESGLANWTIMLSGFDTCDRKPVSLTAITNATGYYEFRNITPGTYVLSELLKPGWLPTTPITQTVIIPELSINIRRDFGNRKMTIPIPPTIPLPTITILPLPGLPSSS